jgi:predicted adenine nucleotide alpha hydrolase (AANH) superfamily ATPase
MNAGRNHGKNKPSTVIQAQEKEKKSETHRAGQAPIGLAVPDTIQPPLLLHACCAPCATHVIELLSRSYSVTALFYNPNIQPDEEYALRLEAMRRLCRITGTPLVVESGPAAVWDSWVQGFEDEPEQGRRCQHCFKGRLEFSVHMAAQRGFPLVATTLTVSPRKSASMINAIGAAVAAGTQVRYLESDFKKKNGFKRSCELSRDYNLYRQNYCGCCYSRRHQDAL